MAIHYDKFLSKLVEKGAGGKRLSPDTLIIDEDAELKYGEIYNSYSECVSYINSVGGAGENNRWRVLIASDITSDIELSPWIFLDGEGLRYQVQAKVTESGESTEMEAYAIYNAQVKTVDVSTDHSIWLSNTNVYDQQTTTGGGRLSVQNKSHLQSDSIVAGYDISSLTSVSADGESGLSAVRTFSKIYAQTGSSIFFDNASGDYLSLIYGSEATVYGDMTVGELYTEKAEFSDVLGTETITINNADWASIIDCSVFVNIEVDNVDLYMYSSVLGSSSVSAVNGGTINNMGAYYNNGSSGLSATDVQAALDELMGKVAHCDTIWVPADALTPSVTDGATAVTSEYATNDMTHNVMRYAYSANDTHAEFDLVMPELWDNGTLKVKVYWTAGGSANPDDYVRFYIAAGARSNDNPLDAALGTSVNIDDQLIADDDLHITAASAEITVGGTPATGDLIHIKLSRDYDYAGEGNQLEGVVDVLGVTIQYKKDNTVTEW